MNQTGTRTSLPFRGIALALLLVALAACTSPLDPIVQEQKPPSDPTTDPRDGSAFRGALTFEANFV